MSFSMDVYHHRESCVVKLKGILNAQQQDEFLALFDQCARGTPFVLDMGQTEHIDSAGLGMLLMPREYAGGSNESVSIRNVSRSAAPSLRIANFDKLFRFS